MVFLGCICFWKNTLSKYINHRVFCIFPKNWIASCVGATYAMLLNDIYVQSFLYWWRLDCLVWNHRFRIKWVGFRKHYTAVTYQTETWTTTWTLTLTRHDVVFVRIIRYFLFRLSDTKFLIPGKKNKKIPQRDPFFSRLRLFSYSVHYPKHHTAYTAHNKLRQDPSYHSPSLWLLRELERYYPSYIPRPWHLQLEITALLLRLAGTNGVTYMYVVRTNKLF